MKRGRPRAKELALLVVLTCAAIGVHGYHPATEDAEIYTPGILKLLHPSLFPHDSQFFEQHARMTLFPHVVAGSIRVLRLPVDIALLGWQAISIFLFLLACWRIARLCFTENSAVWCGVGLVGALLSIVVAGTELSIMDPYLTTRSLSTPFGLLAVAGILESAYVEGAAWTVLTAAVHPLMAVFVSAYLAILVVLKRRRKSAPASGLILIPWKLFPPMTPEYRQALHTREYYFLTSWAWYEWLGLVAPFALLAWFDRLARRYALERMGLACRALLVYGAIFFAMALVISVPGRFENFAEIQPLRSLHLLYMLMFLFMGALLGKFVLQSHVWRWALLFAPLCAGMWFAQQRLLPATPHLEMPGRAPGNAWVQAFDWIRRNTPEDAYFALDPDHMALPGEDQHGFRAIAQRSMLADAVKDSGAASMFPALARDWVEQVSAQRGWRDFQRGDFLRLRQKYGVNWVVLQRPGVRGMECPYANGALLVCRME